MVESPKSWEEAQAACVKEGGNLASVDMSYEQAFISGAIQEGQTEAWIGLQRTVQARAGTDLILTNPYEENKGCENFNSTFSIIYTYICVLPLIRHSLKETVPIYTNSAIHNYGLSTSTQTEDIYLELTS